MKIDISDFFWDPVIWDEQHYLGLLSFEIVKRIDEFLSSESTVVDPFRLCLMNVMTGFSLLTNEEANDLTADTFIRYLSYLESLCEQNEVELAYFDKDLVDDVMMKEADRLDYSAIMES